jgi:hypothetical protein
VQGDRESILEEEPMSYPRRTPRPAARIAAWMLALGLGGALIAAAEEPKTRAFRQPFPAQAAELRLDNLAGRVELVRADGREVVVEATVHALGKSDAETRKLLDGMKWVRSKDSKGRDEWALSYPVDQYTSYHYPQGAKGQDEDNGFWSFLFGSLSSNSVTYRGERVRIYGTKRSGDPTLYVDLRIALPAGSQVAVRNVVGPMNGTGALEGTLSLKAGSGAVTLASYAGRLTVDTGSGRVVIGTAKGETAIDTGSGDVTVRNLVGNGSIDTGSGSVTVESLSAGKLALDTGSGDVLVKSGDAGRVIADTGSGSVKVLGVELEELVADTGSGDVVVHSSLARTKKISADTGSGGVHILAGPDASFDVDADQGSGDLVVKYPDAVLRKSGRRVVGAKRGDGRTQIHVETGSGDCIIGPKQES